MNKLVTLFFLILFAISCSQPDYDLLIKNGMIYDGSGTVPAEGHVLVHDGVIVQAGNFDLTTLTASITIDAEGHVISPGFIDSHSRGEPLETPRFDNFLSMGVTTITLGLVGTSPGAEDLASWMSSVDEKGTGPNIIHFTGHSTIRELTGIPRQEDVDASYIDAMREQLQDAMDEGSFGLSLGLEFEPGSFAGRDELVDLASAVADRGGILMGHVRSEDDDRIDDSVIELMEIGLEADVQTHISHLKIVFADDPQRAEDVLELIEEARQSGLRVTSDLYPYIASFTTIGLVFPDWANTQEEFDEAIETRRDELSDYLRNRIEQRNGPEATLFGTEPWTGMTLAEVADELDKPFEEALIEDIGPEGGSAAYFVMNEDVMQRFLVDPHVMVSTDGGPEMRHPRGFGSFAKIIRKYVNELNLFPLEEAIYKMSGLPAETLGLTDEAQVDVQRGLIREGFAADLLIFDPEKVNDPADFENPHTLAEGFDWVIVNGVALIEEGERNGLLPSGMIRRNVE
ncbi:MAG: amidohydrolase family protein [Balneolaceae bacterium]|nr:amidohydrolase family protein [Balneolaceae bacterium]